MRSNTNVFCGSDNNNNNAYHGSNTIKNIHTSGQKLQTSINNLGVGHQLQIGNNYGYQHPMLPHPQHTQPNLPPPPPPSATHPSLWAAQAPRNPTCYPQPGCMPSNAHLNTTTYQGRQFQGRGFPYPCNFSGQPCERINLSAPNYAKLPPLSVVNQQRINDCAGIPLISTAVAHLTPNQRQRISRKQSHSPPPRNWANLLPAGVHSHNYCNQLVAHAQGPPLLLNKQQHLTIGQQQQQQQQGNQPPNHWNPSNCYTMHGGYSQQQQFTAKCQMPQAKQDIIRSPLRYQNSAPAALTNCKSNEILAKIDCSDIKNAENVNNGDACLPRIIKPRKRRKKDRKPNNLVNGLFLKMENQIKTAEKQSNPAEADILKCLNHFTNIYSNSTEECTTRHKQKNIKNIYTEQQQASDENKFIKNHGICFCVECDPLRSIWEHPLRRSPSDSSESSSTSSSSNATTTSSNDSKSAQDESRCRLIEKQKSESNLNAWPKSRADIVGVIGSNRISHEHNAALTQTYAGGTQESNGGYANILSGINLANDLFSRTASTHTLNHNILTIMPNNNNNNKHNSELIDADADADAMVLLPETAETLLTRSINEISQKLIETCSNEFGDLLNSSSTSSCGSSSSSSGSSGISDFSNDSGIDSAHINCDDLVFNFDQLHIPGNSSTLTSTSISTSTSTSTSTSACNNLTSARATTSITPTATNKYAAQSFLTTLPTITTLTSSGNQSNNKLLTPTLDLLVDFNNNQQQQHQSARMPQSLKQKLILNDNHWQQQHQHQHQQQCNELQSFQRPEQQQQQQQHQFFSNCYDLLWHQKHQHHHHQQQQ